MATMMQAPAIRRANSMRVRVEEVADDIAIQEADDNHCNALEALVCDCGSLAEQWRAVIEHFSQQIACRQDVDLRTAGDILRPTAQRTRAVYEKVQQWVIESPCPITSSDKTDLRLAIIEVCKWQEWLSNWPTWDSEKRDAARRNLAEEKLMTPEDEQMFIARLQGI